MKEEMGEKSVSLTDWNGRENNLSNHAALSSNSGRHIALLLVEAEVRDFFIVKMMMGIFFSAQVRYDKRR